MVANDSRVSRARSRVIETTMSVAVQLIGRGGLSTARKPVRERSDGQMFLDLPPVAVRKIFLVAVDEVHGVHLKALLNGAKDGLILDLRNVLRFDLPSMNRSQFFDAISQSGSEYVRVPVRWHELNAGPLVTESALPQQFSYEILRKSRGYIIVLVPREPHARYVASAMNVSLREHGQEDWEIN